MKIIIPDTSTILQPSLYMTKLQSFMRTLITSLKSAPFYLTGGYIILVILDIATTYLATPDLKYEGNKIVQYFHLGWSEIILLYTLQVILYTIGFSMSYHYIYNYYNLNGNTGDYSFFKEVFHHKKLLLSFFLYGCFFKQFFYTTFIVINNYLGYIYIFKIENFITAFSTWFRNMEIENYPYFFPVAEAIFIIIGIIYTIFRGAQIKRNYQNRPDLNVNPSGIK